MKDIIKKFGVGLYVAIPAVIFAFLSYVFYSQYGVTDFAPKLDQTVLTATTVGAILALVAFALSVVCTLVKANAMKYVKIAVKPVGFAAFLVLLYAFIGYIRTQATLITNLLVAIDPTEVKPGWTATMVFYVLAVVLSVVAASMIEWTPWIKEENDQIKVVENSVE